MDVFNVTGQYTELIDSQKKTLQEAKKRQAQQPCNRNFRDYAYRKFMAALKFEGIRGLKMIHLSFIPPAYIPCTVGVDKIICIDFLSMGLISPYIYEVLS